tara:strand:- start:129 stop:230 length:102 start_codon:yes stop_codon:yes gene_type:complete
MLAVALVRSYEKKTFFAAGTVTPRPSEAKLICS